MSESSRHNYRMYDGDRTHQSEARVKFEPNEQLNELLASFLNDEAYIKLGSNAIDLELFYKPYQFDTGDPKQNAIVDAYARRLREAVPQVLRVGRKWEYSSDGTREKPARHLFISMQLGGTALAETVAQEPFYLPGYPLVGLVVLRAKDILPAAALEENRQDVDRELRDHPSDSSMYASAQYVAGRPHLAIRSKRHLRLVE